jgi:hypothetical protein
MARRGLLMSIFLVAACASPPNPTSTPTFRPTPSPTSGPSPSPTPTPTPTATPAGRVFSQADFSRSGGCGDVFFYATSPEDGLSVTIEWRGAATAAWAASGFNGTKQIPDAELDVTLNVGSQLSALYCTDIGTIGAHADGTAHAVSGQVDIKVTPDAGGSEPSSHADVSLHDVVFEVIQGTEVQHWRIDELVLRDISVGWVAG